jgi:V/A-type H+-transporting ATPase subunit I
MIVPMMKYTFLVYHKEYEQFLDKLQEIGMVHVVERDKDLKSDLSVQQFQRMSLAEKHVKFLEKRIAPESAAGIQPDPSEMLEDITHKQLELEQIHHKLESLKKELIQAEPWGDFDQSIVEKLKENEVEIFLFSCLEKHYDPEWEKKYSIEIVNEKDGIVYFAFFRHFSEISFDIPAEQHVFPGRPLHEIKAEIEQVNAQEELINRKFDEYSLHLPAIKAYAKDIYNAFSLEKVKLNTKSEADNKLKIVEGWIPKDKETELSSFLDKTGTYFITSAPTEEDKVPVLLSNNKYAKLYEPIGSLFSLPDYKEMDLTFCFAPFYTLFYGMCQADAGYGLLLFLAATFGKLKIKMGELRPILTLVQILSVSTFIFGILTGSFFGVELAKVKWSFLSFMEGRYLDSTTLFYLSMKIGVVHIIYALSIKAYRKIRLEGWLYAINTLGWITVFVTNIIYQGFVKGSASDPALAKMIYNIFFLLGGVMIMFFSDPKKNPLVNFGMGIWDAYGMITGVFGDILSYIRLFALGTSGAILGLVFNNIAISMSPDVPIVGQIIFVLIVVFGHGINIFMSSLGSFVHPMRLTFIEFYKNAGFAGGGKPYRPFSKLK